MPEPMSSRPSYDPQALLNAQPVIVAVIDPATYTVQFQNETGLRKFGDISGQSCYEKIAGCPSPCAFCKMPEAVQTGRITANEVALSQNQYLLVQWSRAMTADGRVHVIETITDITERKRTEAALHQAEKMEALSRLAGGMAHDFNNLLTVINGYSEQVLHLLDDSDPHQARLKRIQSATERAAALTRNLVAFSHHQILQPTIQDMNTVITDLTPTLRRLLGGQIELSVDLHAEAGQVLTDRQELERVIVNLAVHARDAMAQGGKLKITTAMASVDEALANQHNARPGRYVQVAVHDTGSGIAPEMRAHIFEPFFTSKESGGNGLGLATVYGIVRQTGGFIVLDSERGGGSVFTVHLPRCEQISPAQTVAHPGRTPKSNETILLVEDDEDVRIVVGDMLRAQGYTVREASDGADALQLLPTIPDPLHLILTDVMMPRMTGPQFVKRIESILPTAKVLYMSGYTGDILEAVSDQPLAFIQKPFTAQLLAKKVRETLAG